MPVRNRFGDDQPAIAPARLNYNRPGLILEIRLDRWDDLHRPLLEIEHDPLRAQRVDPKNAVGTHVRAGEQGRVRNPHFLAGQLKPWHGCGLNYRDPGDAVQLSLLTRCQVQM